MARPTLLKKRVPTAKALIELRHRLGETQQSMSQRLGISLQSIARWETNSLPTGGKLTDLHKLAREHAHEDLAQIFDRAFAKWKATNSHKAQQLDEEFRRIGELEYNVAQIQEEATRLKEAGNPSGTIIYDLCNDLWLALEKMSLAGWKRNQ